MSSKPTQSTHVTKPAMKASKKSAAQPAPGTAEAAQAVAAAPTPTVASTPAPVVPALPMLPAPPPSATIPSPPSGADAPGGQNYRGVVPRKIELAALPGAVSDLQRCTSFSQIFGATGLPYAQVLQAFEISNDWSTMRNATDAWDTYCQTQEGICWGVLRVIMDTLKPAFDVAIAGNPGLATTLPSFATLFNAKNVIAQKSASTRRLNKAAVAKGEAPTHGAVGKQRQRAAEKAALAATKASGGAAVAPAPAVSPMPSVAPAEVPAAAPTAGTNGAAHS
ncbi:MAG: hypothetical protein ACLQBL_16950 [Polyangiaceae bacterium]|jgi:hypothetical protein